MNTLFKNLKSIYRNKPSLEIITPSDETYLLLRDFLLTEISRNRDFLSPYDYSYKYKKDVMNTLNLFLSISEDDKILLKYYFVECECGDPTISRSLDSIYDCTHCHAVLDTREDVFDKFNNIHYVFKINPDVMKELKYDLKVQPSFSPDEEKEGLENDVQDTPSLLDVLEVENEELSEVEKEKQRIREQFSVFASAT